MNSVLSIFYMPLIALRFIPLWHWQKVQVNKSFFVRNQSAPEMSDFVVHRWATRPSGQNTGTCNRESRPAASWIVSRLSWIQSVDHACKIVNWFVSYQPFELFVSLSQKRPTRGKDNLFFSSFITKVPIFNYRISMVGSFYRYLLFMVELHRMRVW